MRNVNHEKNNNRSLMVTTILHVVAMRLLSCGHKIVSRGQTFFYVTFGAHCNLIHCNFIISRPQTPSNWKNNSPPVIKHINR